MKMRDGMVGLERENKTETDIKTGVNAEHAHSILS